MSKKRRKITRVPLGRTSFLSTLYPKKPLSSLFGVSRNLNFLGSTPKKPTQHMNSVQFFSGIPKPMGKMPQLVNWMGKPSFFKKESIKSKKLKPWGDADMDGSPNKFDCDPRRANRDGLFDTVKKMFGKKPVPVVTKSTGGLRESAESMMKRSRGGKYADMSSKKYPYSQTKSEETLPTDFGKGYKKPNALETAKKKYIQFADVANQKIQKLDTSIRTDLDKANKLIQERREEFGSQFEGSAQSMDRTQDKLKQISRNKNIRTAAKGLAVAILPAQALYETKLVKGRMPAIRKAGRPRGSKENKYAEFGGVLAYRKWAVQQNKLSRLRGFSVKLPRTLNTEQDKAKVRAYKAATQGGRSGAVMAEAQSPQLDYSQPSQNMSQGMPTQSQDEQIQIEAQQPQVQQPSQTDMDEFRKFQQSQAQKNDSILMAPQFMKGQLKNVGGEDNLTYTKPSENILNAPNFSQGQMRTMNQNKEIPSVVVGPPPRPNGYENEYIEIDIGSGKEKVVKRIKEKWLNQGDEFGQFDKNNPARISANELIMRNKIEAGRIKAMAKQVQEQTAQEQKQIEVLSQKPASEQTEENI